jgi:hypothetical protein
MKRLGIVIAALIALMAFGTGLSTAACDGEVLTVLPGEHIVLTGAPYISGSTQYSYLWDGISGLTEDGGSVTQGLYTLTFDAPTTAGDTEITLTVTNTLAPGSACKGETCITIHVCDSSVCPTIDNSICTDKTPIWTATICHWDSTLIGHWIVNDAEVTTGTTDDGAGTYTYSPDLLSDPFVQPTSSTPTQSQTVEFEITQSTAGHTSIPTNFDCSKTFDLQYDPSASTTISHSP